MLNSMDGLKPASSTCCEDGTLEIPKLSFQIGGCKKVAGRSFWRYVRDGIRTCNSKRRTNEQPKHSHTFFGHILYGEPFIATSIKKFLSIQPQSHEFGTIHVLSFASKTIDESKIFLVMVGFLNVDEVAEVACLHSPFFFKEIGHKSPKHAIKIMQSHAFPTISFRQKLMYSINHKKWFSP